MKKGRFTVIGILVLIVVIIVIVAISQYNGLVRERENVRAAESNIQTQLQRRSDLIPNLVQTVKGYAAHEEEVITAVSDARAQLAGAQTPDEVIAGDAALSSALSRLLVIVENYPDLKANTNFIQLQDELAGTENRIATARKDYNNAAQTYNRRVQSFPTVLYAKAMGFDILPYFQAQPGADVNPTVSFG